jgi:exodeoxyribonuclease V beta subunit
MISNPIYKKIGLSSFNGVPNVDDKLTHDIDHTSYQYDQIKGLSEKKSYKSSYSSLSHGEVIKEEEYDDEQKDLENPINNDFNLTEYDMNACQMKSNVDSNILHEAYDGIPKGSTIGTALHEIFERIDFTNYKHNLDEIIKDRLIANRIKVTDKILDYIHKMMDNVLNALLPELDGTSFKLSEISMDNRKAEIEFNFNLKKDYFKNYCNGFIDLLFRRGNKYYILDWKSDTLNDEFLSYSDLAELKKHTDKLYSIQRVLYSYCLIKWLEPLLNKNEEEIFKNYFGGIYYVYIRGCNMKTGNGIYAQKWNSYEELEDAFNAIIDNKIGW